MKILRFLQILLYPQNFNHKFFRHSIEENILEFIWWNGAFKAYVVIIFKNISTKKFLLSNPQWFPSLKLNRYTVIVIRLAVSPPHASDFVSLPTQGMKFLQNFCKMVCKRSLCYQLCENSPRWHVLHSLTQMNVKPPS